MLNYKAKIYTVYKKEGEDLPILVPEGFSLWAFIFPINIFWAINRKCWLFLALVIATEVATTLLTGNGIISKEYFAAFRVPIYIGLGAFANDFHRVSLERRGYKMVNIIAADSEIAGLKESFKVS
jgi:hypothetical protein